MLCNENNTYNEPKSHTTQPSHVATSVIGIKYDKGVIIAGDCVLNVGYKKFNNIEKIVKINKNTMIGCSGEFSDFQELTRILVEKSEEDELYDGVNSFFGPSEISNYLSHICYNKRSKMDPYWNTTIVGGFNNDEPFMNSIDQFGTKYERNWLVSGFASYFAGPIMEQNVPTDHKLITRERAIELIDHLLRVLFYRDAAAGDRINYGVMEKNNQGEPEFTVHHKKLTTNWEHEKFKTSHNEKYHPMA